MLPKILVGFIFDKEGFFKYENLNENFVLGIDAAETNLSEFREWITFCQNVLDEEGQYSMVIWNAGKLSVECQNVLLKPLEEKKVRTRIYLLTNKEDDLLPTVLSRCEVILNKASDKKEIYWKEVVSLWRRSPAEILEYSEKFKVDDLEALLNEVVQKIKVELQNEVNKKRLKILSLALEVLKDLNKTNVSKRMALESFLLSSWRVIKT